MHGKKHRHQEYYAAGDFKNGQSKISHQEMKRASKMVYKISLEIKFAHIFVSCAFTYIHVYIQKICSN